MSNICFFYRRSNVENLKGNVKKQKSHTANSKDDELDLLGDDVDSFTGSNADLESAADNLFTSPPHPQPASLGNTLNIHLQQQMGSSQASVLEAFQSLRKELTTQNHRWIRPRLQLLSLVPTRKEAPHKAVTNRFPQVGENRTSKAPGVVFDPTTGGEGMETPLPNDSSKASLSPPIGGRHHSWKLQSPSGPP